MKSPAPPYTWNTLQNIILWTNVYVLLYIYFYNRPYILGQQFQQIQCWSIPWRKQRMLVICFVGPSTNTEALHLKQTLQPFPFISRGGQHCYLPDKTFSLPSPPPVHDSFLLTTFLVLALLSLVLTYLPSYSCSCSQWH